MDPWHVVAIPLGVGCALGLALVSIPWQQSDRSRPHSTLGAPAVASALQRAGWGGIHPVSAIALWLGLSVLVGIVTVIVLPIPALAFLAMTGMVVAGARVVRSRISRRERRLRQAWPGVVDHLRSAVRSGASVSEAVVLAGRKAPGEIGEGCEDFARLLEQGVRVDSALAALKHRLANPIADRIVESLRMAHEVGGHALPAVLEALQTSVRADIAIREDAIARQSWIRAASTLGAAAPWIVVVVLSGRQETVEAYNTPLGSAILCCGAALTWLAHRMMSRLGRLPDDSRWFAG
jgi:tight adherence protein B